MYCLFLMFCPSLFLEGLRKPEKHPMWIFGPNSGLKMWVLNVKLNFPFLCVLPWCIVCIYYVLSLGLLGALLAFLQVFPFDFKFVVTLVNWYSFVPSGKTGQVFVLPLVVFTLFLTMFLMYLVETLIGTSAVLIENFHCFLRQIPGKLREAMITTFPVIYIHCV